MKTVESVTRILESIGAAYALIGGRAVGARGYPRMTLDYDFLTTDRRVLQPETWKTLIEKGAAVDPRKGDFDDPLGGVVHITLPDGVESDVVLAKQKWEQGVIDRAERLDIGGIEVPVPLTSDLILLKLSAGGVVDLQDIVVLLNVSDTEKVASEVESKVSQLPADAVQAWQRIRASE